MVENAVILAGGAGKRLWPASLGNSPKQFMDVDGSGSLFRGALERAFGLNLPGLVYVVTHQSHVESALAECRNLDDDLRSRLVILAEPVARNTAPALALAAARCFLDGRLSETMLVMAADHIISPLELFSGCVEAASRKAAEGCIVTYGIVPAGPATGYGYIETGKAEGDTLEVLSFREKPDEETARSYLDSDRYFWNSGIFTYQVHVFIEELERCSPEVGAPFSLPDESWFNLREEQSLRIYEPSGVLRHIYEQCPSISVDYAVMEKTRRIRMVKAGFQWNDAGSWDVLAGLKASHKHPVYSCHSSGNYVYADVPVALCGVDDLIVVAANNRVLVCRKGMSQLVKDAAEADLKNNNH